MTTEENIIKFKEEILDRCYNVRDTALFTKSPLFTVSQSPQDKEITKKELDLLNHIIMEFTKYFPEVLQQKTQSDYP